MKALIATLALLLPFAAAAEPVVYEEAQVWTGRGFAPRTLAVDQGRFVEPSTVASGAQRVSLSGRFVTPAYANAHAHITNATERSSRGFTDAGVFYVWNPNTVTIGAEERRFYGQARRYSVRVAQGGITEPGGHPERLYVDYLSQNVYPGRDRAWFIGNAFHFGTTRAEIDAVLTLLQQQGAEFVKIYLLHSEEYQLRRDDQRYYGSRGLNPANVPYLVQQAHARGLKVSAHVETAHDLRVAAAAGVDFAMHLPGYGSLAARDRAAARITPAIAALVARSRMRVVPTYAIVAGGDRYEGATSADARATVAVQTENLRLLRAAGVPILIGTDGFNQIWSEAEHLVNANGMPAAEVAASLFKTGRFLFPERRIGCFQPGCEADFLVLTGDPTADIRALRRIESRFMGGATLPGPVAVARP